MTGADSQRYRFADCELDERTRELVRAGAPVRLEPRVFDLLAFLIRHRDRAVNKDQIQDAVWTGVIVTETALTRAIMKARRAVGDSAGRQDVIRTVHGHGYQFVAAVDLASRPVPQDAAPLQNTHGDGPERAAAAPASVTPTPAVASPRPRRRWWPAVAAAVVVGAMVAWLWPAPGPAAGVRIAVLPVQNVSGSEDLEWTRLGLMGFANSLLQSTTQLDVVAASEMMRFAENTGWTGALDAADANGHLDRLRRSLGATHVLVSALTRTAGGMRLTYTLVNPQGDERQGTMVHDEGTELVRGMVRGVSEALRQRPRLRDQHEQVSADPFINEAFARGMSFSLQGRCADALPLFAVVVGKNAGIVRARLEWAKCAHIQGQWREAETALNALLAQLPATQPSAIRAETLSALGTVYLRTGRVDEANATYMAGLDDARATGDANARGELLNSLAIVAKDRRDFAGARELLARATAAYHEGGREVVPGQVPSALANIAMSEGKLEQAHEHLATALATFRTLGDRRNEAKILNNTGYLLRLQGRFPEAEPFHRQSLAIRRDIGDRVGQGRILGMLSNLYDDSGRFEEARDAAYEAVTIAREANDRLFLATGLAQLGTAYRGLEDLAAARAAYIEARDVFDQIDDRSRSAQLELRLATLDIAQEQLDAATSRVEQVLATALDNKLHEPAIEALDMRGDLALLAQDTAAARVLFEQAIALMDSSGFTARKTSVTIKLAHLYLDDGDTSATEPLLGHIVAQAHTRDTLKLMARVAWVKGDSARSVTLMEEARALAPDNWSPGDAEQLMRYRGVDEE